MQQLIILHQSTLASFLANQAPLQSVLLLLCAPSELSSDTLSALAKSSAEIYWLSPPEVALPYGEHANYDKWAELSVQCERTFFWPV